MSVRLNQSIINLSKLIFSLLIGISIFYLVYRKINFSEIIHVWKSDVKLIIIIMSLFFGVSANIVRALRWKLLIKSLQENPKNSNLIPAVLGSYSINYLFPRFGEIWRCGVISKHEKIPFAKLIGTLIVDRFFDVVMVILILLFSLVINLSSFKTYVNNNPGIIEKVQTISYSKWVCAIILMLLLLLLFFKYFDKYGIYRKIKYMSIDVWNGIKSIWYLKNKTLFFIYTVMIWGGYFSYFYICFFAFDFTADLGWKNGVMSFGISSASVALPVPGGIGIWHAVVSTCLIGFGVSDIQAKSFAFIVYFVQNLLTAIIGLFGILYLSLIGRPLKSP